MYISYMIYEAERVKTAKEQREDDVRAGQLAAGLRRLSRSPGRRAGTRRTFRRARR